MYCAKLSFANHSSLGPLPHHCDRHMRVEKVKPEEPLRPSLSAHHHSAEKGREQKESFHPTAEEGKKFLGQNGGGREGGREGGRLLT